MADATYLIDIAAQLTGRETADELDRITASLTGAGKGSEVYGQAVKRLATELDSAKIAAEQAGAALASGQDEYRQLEREAIKTAKALERSQGKGVFDARAAREADAARVALDGYTGKLRGLEAGSKRAADEQKRLEKAQRGVKAIGDHQGAALNDEIRKYRALAGAARLLPGPLGRIVGEHFREETAQLRLGKAFGVGSTQAFLFASATLIAAAAIVALSVATVAGAASLAGYAIAQADAGRSWQLSRDAFAALGPVQAEATKHFDAISRATGATDESLRGMTTTLRDLADPLKSGIIASADVSKALRAAALAEAALGKGGSAQFIQRIQEGQLSVKAFADFAEKKFGPIVEKQLLGLTAQSARFSNLWAGLFSKLDIEPVLRGLDRLLGDLETGEPLAKAFQFVLGEMFGPVTQNAEGAAIAIEAAALKIAIGFIKAYLAVKPYADQIQFGLEVIAIGAGAVVAVVGLVAVVLGVAAVALLAVVAGLAAFGYAIGLGIAMVIDFGVAVAQTFAGWYDSAVQWGSDLMAGLVAGIVGAAKDVYNAVSGVVGGVISTAEEILGIASPSKVFAGIGENTAEGYQQGVESGTPGAQGAVSAMASPTDAQVKSGSVGGRSSKVDLNGASFHFYGVPGAEAARDMFAEALTAVLEGDAERLAGAEV